jgi:IPT/TIG domain-containing protein
MKTVQIAALAGLLAIGLACGYSNHTTMPPQPGTMPAIAQLVPTNANAGTAFTLTVNGSNFASGAGVNFNGAAQTTMHVSASQLTVTIPGTADTNSGTVPVTVTNPGTAGGQYGGGTLPETSAPMSFTIN